MGLFDFVKEIGQGHIEANNPGIAGLGIDFKDGVVSLAGQASTPEAMEKAVLMAGNVKGVSDVKIDGLKTPETTGKVEYYIIQKGDTLSAIAKQFYKKASDCSKVQVVSAMSACRAITRRCNAMARSGASASTRLSASGVKSPRSASERATKRDPQRQDP